MWLCRLHVCFAHVLSYVTYIYLHQRFLYYVLWNPRVPPRSLKGSANRTCLLTQERKLFKKLRINIFVISRLFLNIFLPISYVRTGHVKYYYIRPVTNELIVYNKINIYNKINARIYLASCTIQQI